MPNKETIGNKVNKRSVILIKSAANQWPGFPNEKSMETHNIEYLDKDLHFKQ